MREVPVVPEVKEQAKPTESKAPVKKLAARKKAAKKLVTKTEATKVQSKIRKPSPKKAGKKAPAKRMEFLYARVLRMWKAGKTLEVIARATGRYQENADDPLRSFRISLTRFHKGVRINGKLMRLPYRISKKALKADTRAGKRAAA